MATLQVRTPDHSPSAAQHVGHVVQLAAALLDRDAAYVRNGTVYARTARRRGAAPARPRRRAAACRGVPRPPRRPGQGRPARRHGVAGHRPDDEVSWPSPWGDGRPGWHAECAAMVLALFGPSVDLHCGGADLAFPHHACEAALAEAATGVTPFARAWLRAGHGVDQRRQDGQVAGNLVLVEDLLRDYSRPRSGCCA